MSHRYSHSLLFLKVLCSFRNSARPPLGLTTRQHRRLISQQSSRGTSKWFPSKSNKSLLKHKWLLLPNNGPHDEKESDSDVRTSHFLLGLQAPPLPAPLSLPSIDKPFVVLQSERSGKDPRKKCVKPFMRSLGLSGHQWRAK